MKCHAIKSKNRCNLFTSNFYTILIGAHFYKKISIPIPIWIKSLTSRVELRNKSAQEKMCLKICWIAGSFLQADCWWLKTSGYTKMAEKVLKPRKQCLDQFILQQWALKRQGCSKSGVKFCCPWDWMLYLCTCAFKHSFSHELVKNSTQLKLLGFLAIFQWKSWAKKLT